MSPLCASPVFVGLFAKFRRAIVSYVMSFHLSALWNNSVPIGWIFFKICDGCLLKAAKKIQVWLQYDKNKFTLFEGLLSFVTMVACDCN